MLEILLIITFILALLYMFSRSATKGVETYERHIASIPNPLEQLTEVWECGYCRQLNETRPQIGPSTACQNCHEIRLPNDRILKVTKNEFYAQAQYDVRAWDDFIKWFLQNYPYTKGDIAAGRIGNFKLNEAKIRYELEHLSREQKMHLSDNEDAT